MMNIFNRLLMVVLLVGLVVVLTLAIVRPVQTVASIAVTVGAISDLAQTQPYVFLAAAAALLFVALLLLILELRRPQRRTVKVKQVSGGVAELATESVTRSLGYHLSQLPGIVSVHPDVVSKGTAVKIALGIETDPQVDIPAKTEEIVQLTHEVIEGKLGLVLASVRVSITQAPYGQGVPSLAKPQQIGGEPQAIDGPPRM